MTKRLATSFLLMMLPLVTICAKTLIVYYSFTNNVHQIMTELHSQIPDADIVRIEPAEKGLDYAANNYAIGSALISAIRNNPDDASSYPAIDPVNISMDDYDTVILGTPLWWSQMAAPFQTFLFNYGSQMAGKNIGLIVSSASSGISGVANDAKRLVPNGNFLSPNLWVRSSQVSNCNSLIANWLNEIDYTALVAGIADATIESSLSQNRVYDLNGRIVKSGATNLAKGIYVVNRKKMYIR